MASLFFKILYQTNRCSFPVAVFSPGPLPTTSLFFPPQLSFYINLISSPRNIKNFKSLVDVARKCRSAYWLCTSKDGMSESGRSPKQIYVGFQPYQELAKIWHLSLSFPPSPAISVSEMEKYRNSLSWWYNSYSSRQREKGRWSTWASTLIPSGWITLMCYCPRRVELGLACYSEVLGFDLFANQ